MADKRSRALVVRQMGQRAATLRAGQSGRVVEVHPPGLEEATVLVDRSIAPLIARYGYKAVEHALLQVYVTYHVHRNEHLEGMINLISACDVLGQRHSPDYPFTTQDLATPVQ